MPSRRTLDARLEIRALGTDRTFTGYGSVFGTLDSYSDVVAPGAFSRSLREWKAKGRMPALLWQHDPGAPIGVWTDISEDRVGLHVTGKISDTQRGREAYALLKDGALSGLSIGFRSRQSTIDDATGIRTLTDIELWEVSLVTFPANDAARISEVRYRTDTARDLLGALERFTSVTQRSVATLRSMNRQLDAIENRTLVANAQGAIDALGRAALDANQEHRDYALARAHAARAFTAWARG